MPGMVVRRTAPPAGAGLLLRALGLAGRLAAVLFCLAALPISSALADKRVALVLGNGAYKNVPPLDNPSSDARAVAERLRALNFDVTEGIDLAKAEMDRMIRGFGDKVAGADIAMVFYAGHGVQVSGRNYLVPVDARMPRREQDLRYDFVDVDSIMDEVAAARELRIVVLDACRDNPIATELGRSLGRSLGGRGLATPASIDSTIVAYATAANATAADGTGNHSPFTSALLKYLPEPGLEIRMLFGRVRDSVRRETGNQQNPFVYASIGGDAFFLNPGPPPVAAAASAAPPTAAAPVSPPSAAAAPVQPAPAAPFAASAGAQVALQAPSRAPGVSSGAEAGLAPAPVAPSQPPQPAPPSPDRQLVVASMAGRWRFSDGGACTRRYGVVTIDKGLIRFEWHLADGSVNVAVERIDRWDGSFIWTTVLSDVGTKRPETGHTVRYTIAPDGWVSENQVTRSRATHQRC